MKFNYIITIHNKDFMLKKVLDAINENCSRDAKIIPVLDGCTDDSEKIVDEFSKSSGLNVIKLIANDVHELKTINTGLSSVTEGVVIILQDDVILKEPKLESLIEDLYASSKKKIGLVSMRMALNIKKSSIFYKFKTKFFNNQIQECDMLIRENDFITGVPKVKNSHFMERMVAIKGPNFISYDALHEVGILNEDLAPYGYDDHELCIRLIQKGYTNGIFPLRFITEEDWGGSRKDPTFSEASLKIFHRNRTYIWNKYCNFILGYWNSRLPNRETSQKFSDYIYIFKEKIINKYLIIKYKGSRG